MNTDYCPNCREVVEAAESIHTRGERNTVPMYGCPKCGSADLMELEEAVEMLVKELERRGA